MSAGGTWVVLPFLATLAIAGIIGMPIAALFFPGMEAARCDWRRVFAAPILGTVALFLACYAVAMAAGLGTDRVVHWVVLGGLLSTIPYYRRHGADTARTLMACGAVILLCAVPAAWSVIGPVAQGRWEMAYSIGNDGARYLMMIEHLQSQCWVFGASAQDPLSYPLFNRPLQHYSGAIVASLWGVGAPLAYTIAAALAAALVAAAMMLCIECFAKPAQASVRLASGLLAILAAGFGGAFVNVYYSGYLGQHFSVFLVIAALAGLSLIAEAWRFVAWCALFGGALALGYSLTLTFTFVLLAVMPVAAEAIRRRPGWKTVSVQFLALVVALATGMLLSAYERQHMGDVGGVAGIRNAKFAWGAADSLLRWSGMVNMYDNVEMAWSRLELIAMLSLPLLMAACAILAAVLAWGRATAISLAFIGAAALAAFMIATRQSYLVNKVSLYWPFFCSIMILCGVAVLQRSWLRWLVLGATVFLLAAFWGISGRMQMAFHEAIVAGRGTRVDGEVRGLIAAIAGIPAASGRGPAVLYVQDPSAERHLLLRQLLKEHAWQPAPDAGIWDEFGYRPAGGDHPAWFDDYHPDAALIVREYPSEAELVDRSGDSACVRWQSGRYLLLGDRATLVEPDGFSPRMRDWENDAGRRVVYAFDGRAAGLRLVNRGDHRLATIDFRIFGPAQGVGIERLMMASLGTWSGTTNVDPHGGWRESRLSIPLVAGLNDLRFTRLEDGADIVVERIAWE